MEELTPGSLTKEENRNANISIATAIQRGLKQGTLALTGLTPIEWQYAKAWLEGLAEHMLKEEQS
jgi:hypothetical protein